jgi:dolichyl-diphosphooligosaccharide--protein glycosyltransferase
VAIGGLVLALGRQLAANDPPAEGLLVAIWFLFMIAATFTQSRFGYYLAVPVAAMAAVGIGSVMRFVGRVEDITKVEPYQVMTVVSVIIIVLAPMFIGAGASVGVQAMDTADRSQSPGAGIVGWSDSLDWMENNTAVEGQYANPDGEPIEYYGTYARTDDYDYPEGSYGVMSWWDYGHWITTEAERIPVANPFQQQAQLAAEFLTAQTENESAEVLEEVSEDDAETRYVMVDWKMAETETQIGGKYFAPIRFNPNTTRSEFYTRVLSPDSLRESGLAQGTEIIRQKQAYYNSTMVRLYRYHGSSMEPQPWVLDWQGAEQQLGNGDTYVRPSADGQTIKRFRSMQQAENYVENDSTSQIGGFGPYPSERVPALEHYRLVHASQFSGLQGRQRQVFTRDANTILPALSQLGLPQNATQQQLSNAARNVLYPTTPSWVKTFERVPGATIDGSGGPANASFQLRVELNPSNGRNFTYTQRVNTDENGEFTATVPYATTGYDALGPDDGYTNTSVRATGPYEFGFDSPFGFQTFNGTTNVTERQVLGVADDPTASVDLDYEPPSDGNGTDGNTTDENTTDGNTTDGTDSSTSDGTTDGTSDTSGDEQQSVTADPTSAIRAD